MTSGHRTENLELSHDEIAKIPGLLEELLEAGQAITSSLELQYVLRQIVKGANTVLRADVSVIYPYRQDENKFSEPVTWGETTAEPKLVDPLPQEGGVASKVIKEEMVIIENLDENPDIASSFTTREGIASFVAVALRTGEETVGVLYVNFRNPHRFTAYELRISKIFADYGAIAIQNARLYESASAELQRKVAEFSKLHQVEERTIAELRALREIDRAILSAGVDLDETLQTLLNSSLKLIGAKYGNLLLVEGDELVIKATTTEPKEEEIGTRLKIGDSVSGLPVIRKEAVVIPDVDQEPLYRRVLEAEYMRSELAVPLMENGRVIGVLNVESPGLNAFTEHHKELLEMLAGQAAIAIKNAQHSDELRALREIDRAILSAGVDLDETLQTLLNSSLKLIGAKYGNLLLVEGDELVIKATTTEPKEEEIGTRLKIGDSVSGLPVIRKEAVVIPDVDQEPLYRRVLEAEYMRSELAVPLMENGRVIGVLNVESPGLNAFTEHHKELLEMLAGQAAIAIKNAQHSDELRALREIDKALMRSALDLDATVDIILHQSMDLVKVKRGHADLKLVNRDGLVIFASTEPEEIGILLSMDNSVAGWVVKHKKPKNVPDVDKEPLYQRTFEGALERSALAVPLITDETVIGVLNIESPELDAFTAHDEDLLMALAGQAAIAMSKAELHRELMKAKDELVQTEMIKAVGETASWVVHKIGNLALSLEWPAERLKDEIDPSNESALEDLQMIEDATRQIVEIKMALLGPLQPTVPEPLMIGDILKDALKLAGIPKDVISQNIAVNLPLVKADRRDLVDIFAELLSNAMDAMECVADRKLELAAYMCKDKNCVEVKVSDNGCGIPPENLDKIWAIGFSTKHAQGGTGVGLYKCTQALCKIDAQIFVKSIVGKGTTFTLRIPLWEGEFDVT